MRSLLLILFLTSTTPFAAEQAQLPQSNVKEIHAIDRSSTERRRFAKEHPCPATGIAKPDHCSSVVATKKVSYVIDHVVPLCAGGADLASNMQWSREDIAKIKDRVEKATCFCLRKYGPDAGCPIVDWKAQPAAKR